MKKPSDPILTTFGARVREIRSDQALSQERLAERCGLHRTYIGSLERGERNIALLNLLRLADGLAVSPERLIAGLSR